MLERSFSDSLLGQASVVSHPHPESKAVLIEAPQRGFQVFTEAFFVFGILLGQFGAGVFESYSFGKAFFRAR